jgi:hypothetical protein
VADAKDTTAGREDRATGGAERSSLGNGPEAPPGSLPRRELLTGVVAGAECITVAAK